MSDPLIYPIRLNKYLASQKMATRREADQLISAGLVYVNGGQASLGLKVEKGDVVELRRAPVAYRYFAFNKPRGIITHSPQFDERDILGLIPEKGIFPIGRLDKDSCGLIILTDDGRITDPLLNPEFAHEKEYEVECLQSLPSFFRKKMESGVDIGGYVTKPCKIHILSDRKFLITLSEGKKHQIRRMCGKFGQSVTSLCRTRIMNIRLGDLSPGSYRAISGSELAKLLTSLEL